MIIYYCTMWVLAIYGILNIILSIYLQFTYRNVDLIVKINSVEDLDVIIKIVQYRYGFFNKNIFVNNIEDVDKKIINKVQEKYGIKFIDKI